MFSTKMGIRWLRLQIATCHRFGVGTGSLLACLRLISLTPHSFCHILGLPICLGHSLSATRSHQFSSRCIRPSRSVTRSLFPFGRVPNIQPAMDKVKDLLPGDLKEEERVTPTDTTAPASPRAGEGGQETVGLFDGHEDKKEGGEAKNRVAPKKGGYAPRKLLGGDVVRTGATGTTDSAIPVEEEKKEASV